MSDTNTPDAASTLAGRNKDYWSANAKNYDTEDWTKRLVAAFTKEMQERADWIGVDWVRPGEDRQIRMLDFACGPGTCSFAFLDRVTQLRGIDLSPAMVDEYNERAALKGISPEKMHATAGDLLADDPSKETSINGPDFFDFDFAIVSFALHHMEKPELALSRLVERLRPGGIVAVLDWTDDPTLKDGQPLQSGHGHGHGDGENLQGATHGHGHGHGHRPGYSHSHQDANKDMIFGEQGKKLRSKHTIAHHGFSKERIETALRAAGCSETGHVVTKETFKFGGAMAGVEKKAFMARGVKQRS